MKDLGGVVPVLLPGHVLGRGDHLDVAVRPFSDCRGRLVDSSLTVRLGGEKVADTNQITKVTGYVPKYGLEEIIVDVAEYHRRRLSDRRVNGRDSR